MDAKIVKKVICHPETQNELKTHIFCTVKYFDVIFRAYEGQGNSKLAMLYHFFKFENI